MKKFMTMTLAAVAFVLGMSSCSSSSSSNDDPQPLVTQVVGSWTGNEIFVVDNEESSNETKTYVFTKASEVTVDLVIPEVGMGMMTIPSFHVKGITLTEEGNTIKGKIAKYEGTVKGVDGSDKAYTITDLTALFSGNTVIVSYSMKYGKMPFPFEARFTGTRQ